MPPVRVIVAGPGDAPDPNAQLWVGDDLMAVTILYDRRLYVRIEPSPDGEPWVIEAASLTLALDEAARRIAEY
jgi:hypothetical protein